MNRLLLPIVVAVLSTSATSGCGAPTSSPPIDNEETATDPGEASVRDVEDPPGDGDARENVPDDDPADGTDDDQPTDEDDDDGEDLDPTDEDVDPIDEELEPDPPVSAGCGSSVGSGTWKLSHDGRDRELLVRVPDSYDPNSPTPVVVNFHGRAMTASQQESFSAMTPVADDNGFIVAYPEGTGAFEQTWNAGVCCGSAQAANVDDVGFAAAMLDELEAELCVDTDRIFAVGMSNGGFLTHRLGCELSDRITAIGAVAGTLPSGDCNPTRPVPVLHFHGTADTVVPYSGFVGTDSAPGSVERWAEINGCSDIPDVYLDEGDVECERWTGCSAGAEVRLCTIAGGGHTWPGGDDFSFGTLGYMTDDISASRHFWEFFSGLSM